MEEMLIYALVVAAIVAAVWSLFGRGGERYVFKSERESGWENLPGVFKMVWGVATAYENPVGSTLGEWMQARVRKLGELIPASALPLTPERYPRLLFVPLEDREEGASIMPGGEGQNDRLRRALEAEGFEVTSFTPPPGYEGMMQPTSAVTDRYDAIIYAASLTTRSNRTTVRISWKNPMGADVPVCVHTLPTIFISLENPYHLIDVPQVRTYINCYAGTKAVVTALMERLTGRARFTRLCCRFLSAMSQPVR